MGYMDSSILSGENPHLLKNITPPYYMNDQIAGLRKRINSHATYLDELADRVSRNVAPRHELTTCPPQPTEGGEFYGPTIQTAEGACSIAYRLDPLFRDVIALEFQRMESMLELTENGCIEFNRIVTSLLKLENKTSIVSKLFIQNTLMDWIASPTDIFSKHLLIAISENVKNYNIWVPISSLVIPHSFPFGPTSVIPLSKAFFDHWEEELQKSYPKEHNFSNETLLSEFRSRFQGKAGVSLEITAEPICARAKALDISEKVCDSLRLFHPGTTRVQFTSATRPEGLSHIRGSFVIMGNNARPTGSMDNILEDPSYFWRIDSQQLSKMTELPLPRLAELTFSLERSEFEDLIMNAIQHYSTLCLKKFVGEKLLCLFVSLEMVLVRKREDGIGINIANRLPIAIKRSADSEYISGLIRKCYRLRSDFVHRGQKTFDAENIENINRLLELTFAFIVQLLYEHGMYNDKEHYISALERRQ